MTNDFLQVHFHHQRNSICSKKSWSLGSEDASVGKSWCSLLGSELGELQIWLIQLSGLIADDLACWLHDSLDDVDVLSSGTVSTGHFVVHLGDGSAESVVSVLLVHVHDTSSSQILEYDSVVLNCVDLALEDLADRHDLTLTLSDLVLTFHLVPELGSGNDGVLSENSDSIACWVWVRIRWRLSANNPVLANLD